MISLIAFYKSACTKRYCFAENINFVISSNRNFASYMSKIRNKQK